MYSPTIFVYPSQFSCKNICPSDNLSRMPVYTRLFRPGGTFFLTLVTEARAPIFADQPARDLLHSAIERCRQLHPFTLDAFVCLPDHLHLLITMPEGDADFSIRIRIIKSNFTHAFLGAGGLEQPRSQSRQRQRSLRGYASIGSIKVRGLSISLTSSKYPPDFNFFIHLEVASASACSSAVVSLD